MVLVKMLMEMEISLPKMGELLVTMMTMISPSGRELPPTESLLPKFPLKTAALRPKSPLLIFFLGQNDLYTRRGAPEVGLGEHNPPGRAWAPWRAKVGALWYLLTPKILINSIKNLVKFQFIWSCAE